MSLSQVAQRDDEIQRLKRQVNDLLAEIDQLHAQITGHIALANQLCDRIRKSEAEREET